MSDISALNAGPRNSVPANVPARSDDALRDVAEAMEAQFLAEMLKSAGFGEARDSFGGGIGEEQFSSFLRQEQARSMARTGGIGLAESIFQSLVQR
ncbi:MAG: rod-binding protein [Albidovulum sp.]